MMISNKKKMNEARVSGNANIQVQFAIYDKNG